MKCRYCDETFIRKGKQRCFKMSPASSEVRAVATEVETGVVAKNDSTLANRLEQQMRKLYKASDVLANVRIKEFRLPSGKHTDLENNDLNEIGARVMFKILCTEIL